MAVSQSTDQPTTLAGRLWRRGNAPLLAVLAFLIAFPFLIGVLNGESPAAVWANSAGNAKFYQGLLIEIFILAIYAISYDLVLGITGLLSFGHAMFFAVGAYLTGILFVSFKWTLLPTLALVVGVGIVQALLFSIVLPRVQGITFALVTLGMASVLHIVIRTRELAPFTGADVGLQGVIAPDWINPNTERLRFYFLALAFMFAVYFLYRRFVNSPTGRACIAIRENEDRARMLGFNTFYFKVVVLIIASITAALAGSMHAVFQPLVSPNVADWTFTVAALLMILIGGVGTLSGALIGAAAFRLLSFYLDRFFSDSATFLLGVMYVAIVMFVPYGIVGTWRQRSMQIKQGRERLSRMLTRRND